MSDLNFEDGDRVLIKAGNAVLVYRREHGGAWKLMNLTDWLVTALIDAGKAELQ